MSSIPVFLTAEKHHILIVGATSAAMAKVGLFTPTQARISVIAPGATDALREAGLLPEDTGRDLLVHDRPFAEDDLKGKTLVYIGADDEITEERILRLANTRNLPVNVIDKPAKSNFTTPAQFARGPLQVAFSSGGDAPVFVRRLRSSLEKLLPPSLGVLAAAAGAVRARVKTIIPDGTRRRLFYDRLYDNAGTYADLDQHEVERLVLEAAKSHRVGATTGQVQLVGAGPGDPDLLTIKAHRALQQADVIVYDRLVSRDVLALARRDADLIFVGKREGDHGIGQDGINRVIVEEALKGRRVVRLKGGDPLLFARAGEELDALRAHDIHVEVVPGISAFQGIAATTQIPLTDRAHASSITLVTGHLKDGAYKDWARLAGDGQTLAVYMGVKGAPKISAGLIGEGVKASTPVAVVENGTRANERRFYGTLATLPEVVAKNNVKSPALLLIGDVVSTAADLAWAAKETDRLVATA
ncbi:siroheme synthase CysG [Kordiimonas lipolytica]|jgi:uroporphyrin-III C-methyltransferase/precorrin-2 dehydrogenase/sirohydrochlorin ferrochelatase|uniref:Siroheme synthase CysG n=1 Tax=Kordiimonas lipolytica TaxID=1662421 RepID=A0ABV8UCN8_9PROT